MAGSRRKSLGKKNQDKDFVPKKITKRPSESVFTAPAGKLIKSKELAQDDIYNKNVAHLFSLGQEELNEATQVVDRLFFAEMFFAPPTPLQKAAINGDLEELEEILKTGVRIDDCNGCGQTALFLATEAGHVAVVRELLRRSANPETVNYRNGQRIGSPVDLVTYNKSTPNYQAILGLFIEYQMPKFDAFSGFKIPKFY